MTKFSLMDFFLFGVFTVGDFYCKGNNKLFFENGTLSYEKNGFIFRCHNNKLKKERKLPLKGIFKESFLKDSVSSFGLLYYEDRGRVFFDFELFCKIEHKNDAFFFSYYNPEEWVFICFDSLLNYNRTTYAWQELPNFGKGQNPFDFLKMVNKKGSDLLNDI